MNLMFDVNTNRIFASSTYFLTGLHMYSVQSCNPSSPKHSGYLIIAMLLSGRAIASLHFTGSRFHVAGVGLQSLLRMTSENVYFIILLFSVISPWSTDYME